MAALAATMKETGWAGALLFNKTTGRLIDGHARLQHAMNSATGGKTILPVLVGEWTEAQELKILATHDPLAAMATVDADQLDALLDDVDLTGPGLEDLNEQLNDALADFDAEPEEGDDDEADADSGGGSSGGSKKSKDIPETYQLVITCRDEADQQKLYNRLNRRGYQVKVLTL